MTLNPDIAQKHLDDRFKKIAPLDLFKRPQKGWIKAIRDALGMTSIQLGSKMGVSSPRILAIEKDEALGNIKLSTLERAASAMGCEMVYMIVPQTSLNEMVNRQAETKAKELLKRVEHSMSLENQSSSEEELSMQMKVLVQKFLKGPQARLWDEP